jgi:two-component system sensor histidine kinase ChvG
LEHQDQASDADVVQVKDWFDALAADLGDKLSLQISQAAESARVPSIDLDSIVRNLVDNALRVRKLLPVRVTLEREDQFLKLTVEDDGPGISPANQAQLFKRFFTTERDRGGTGLGLAIVKAVAERRGGRVTLETSTSGTRVIVWF